MKEDNTLSTIWPRKRLDQIATIYIKSPKEFTPKLKRETLDLSKHFSRRFIAKQLKCHPSTLTKWDSTLIQYQPRQAAIPDKQGEPVIQHSIQHDSTVERPHQNVESMLPYVAILLPLELYLVFNGYHLSKSLFCSSAIEAIVMAALAELIPISLCYIKTTTIMRFWEKVIAGFCLLISFLFSVYCVTGKEINSIAQEISSLNQTNEIKISLQNQINAINKDIDYYMNAIRQDSKGKGWPYRVKSLQEEKKHILKEFDIILAKDNKSSWLLWLNLLIVLALRISWQLTSLILASKIFNLVKGNYGIQK